MANDVTSQNTAKYSTVSYITRDNAEYVNVSYFLGIDFIHEYNV